MSRVRFKDHGEHERSPAQVEFANPFSYESSDDARVQLELEARHIPFSYRYFDGIAPTLKQLIPDYNPEFTLREYKTVIVVLNSGFFGSLPGVLDRTALAEVLLKRDGWKVVAWYDFELRNIGVAALMNRDIPELQHPGITGPERPSPFGHPLTMETRRLYLRGQALLRKLFTPKTVEAAGGSTRTRRKFIHRVTGDGGRPRRVSARYQSGD